jgi:hypothetical protein
MSSVREFELMGLPLYKHRGRFCHVTAKLVRAKPDVKYTPQEMVRMAVRTGHWGPWE